MQVKYAQYKTVKLCMIKLVKCAYKICFIWITLTMNLIDELNSN